MVNYIIVRVLLVTKFSMHSSSVESCITKAFVSIVTTAAVPGYAKYRTIKAIVEGVLRTAKFFHPYTVEETEKMLKFL